MAAPTERLPWLHDEPPVKAAAAPTRGAGAMWPWYLLLLVLIAAVAAGAWWLSTAEEAAPPVLPAEESIPIPVIEAEPSEPVIVDPLANAGKPAVSIPGPLPAPPARAIGRDTQPRDLQPQADIVVNDQSPAGRSVFPADDVVTGLPETGPTPVPLTNARPYAGRVVQLGAFPTRSQAEGTWQRITRRYPYLATKPKMVNTVDVRAMGGGRPTRMFRLQLGTSSQAQSVVICQQLERAGHSCVVVY